MAKLKTNCVLCCESTCAPGGSNSKKIRNHALLAEWTEGCVSTLCQSLELDPDSSQALLQGKTAFCSKCLQLIRDMDFLVKNIAQFQKRLRSLKDHIKYLLAVNTLKLENEKNTYAKTVKRIAKSLSSSKLRSSLDISKARKYSEHSDMELGGASDDQPNAETEVNDSSSSGTLDSQRNRRSCRSTYSRIQLKEDPTSDPEIKTEAESDFEEQDNYTEDPDFSSAQEDAAEPLVTHKPKSDLKVKKKLSRPKGSKPPPPKKKLWCSHPNCSAFFLKDWALQAHVSRDHEGNLTPHDCPQCDLKFHSRSAMFTHREASHGIPIVRHPCPKCNKSFRAKFTLKRHIVHMHPVGPARPKCSVCHKAFAVGEDIKEHEDLHTALRTSVYPFACVLCDSPCVGMVALQAHVRKEHDDTTFKCTQAGCEKVFKSSYCLKYHVRTKHGLRDKPHLVCPQCSYRSSAPSALKKHMFTHWDKQPFQCDSCGKTFKYQSTLNRHKALEHNEAAEVFRCTLCPRTFKQKGSLDGHHAHHSTARSFLCEHCPLSFKTMQNLRNHNKVHAPNPTAKPVLRLRAPRKARLAPVLDIAGRDTPDSSTETEEKKCDPDPDEIKSAESVVAASSLIPIDGYDTNIEMEIDFSEVETTCLYIP